jgi:hypothetical protein
VTLRQAVEAIWPVAGIAILWSGVLAVFASAAGWQQRQRPRRQPAQLEFPDRIPPGRIGFEADILDIAAEASAMLRRFQSLAAQQLVRLEMADSRASRSRRTSARSGKSWETLCDVRSSSRLVDVSC